MHATASKRSAVAEHRVESQVHDAAQALEVSVVVPVYGCEACLRALYERLAAVLTPLVSSFELLLVDDRSEQDDWRVISELAARDSRVRGIRLCRNVGQHLAIAAGLAYATGRWTVVMDCDLQDRPEELPRLYQKAQEGYLAVFSRRRDRRDRLVRRGSSRLFHWIYGLIAGVDTDARIGNFSIISRKVVRALRVTSERNWNYAMQVHWLGFQMGYVDVEHAPRHAGESSYSFAKQLHHALATIISQSTRPLYASVGIGFAMSGGAALATVWLIARKLVWGVGITGWTSVMVSLFFLFGMVIMNLGILGLYLGSIFLDLKRRPAFIVEQTTFAESEDE